MRAQGESFLISKLTDILIITFKILTSLCKVLNKVYPFLFLFLVFGSLISSPLFYVHNPQVSLNLISQALAEESSDGESESGGEEEEKEEEEKEEEETEEEKEEEETEEEKE